MGRVIAGMSKILKEVQSINGRRYANDKYYYLVKWKGFSNQWNSWEPQSHFIDKRIIHQYDSRYDGGHRENRDEMHRPMLKKQFRESSKLTFRPSQSHIQSTGGREQSNRRNSSMSQQKMKSSPFQIHGMYLDSFSKIWFNISQGQVRQTIRREQAIDRDYLQVIRFYQRNIRFH